MAESGKAPYFFALIVLLAVLGVYLPTLSNELLFDDLRLTEGSIFGVYGSLLDVKQRMISYGSFVWIEQIFGAGWWKQRIVNIVLHLGVVAAMYGFFKALLSQTRFPQDIEEQTHFASSQRAALRVGVALFALHPMAAYAVGYLIQRSILMATLFAVLACWAFVRGLQTQRVAWYGGALLSYLLAVLSKEHAVMTIALAVPLYIHIKRPGWKEIAALMGGTLLLLAVVTGVLLHFYGNVVGRLFDEQSLAFAQQLEALQPGVTQRMFPLSILNQAALFFAYGLLWVVPYVGWMSIDLRPAFPLGFASSWHIVGGLGYATLLVGTTWLLLRRTGALSLVALLLLLPLVWFATEFSTIWVQDPFVLYRSYLWGVALPGLLAIALTGFKPRTIYTLGIVLGLVFGALALERNLSLADEVTAWTDAAEKTNLKAPANAVGRSRPFLNLGAFYIRKGMLEQAERNIATASALRDRGELGSGAVFNSGVILQLKKKHAEALQAFSTAEEQGYSEPGLYFHKAESQAALGQFVPALENFRIALAKVEKDPQQQSVVPTIRIRLVETAMAAQRYDEAIGGFKVLLQANPNDPRLRLGLGMALVGKGEAQAAIGIFDQLIASHPGAPVYYGRALAHHQAGQGADSLKDLDEAIRLDPRNAQYGQMRAIIAAAKRR
ncbi:tetratricopeptide (TPR) repeat protein [Acidovorax delafieldii]|uniref:Tetratricopeptide (TPR) repeat protein n=1 Tax=Acidovorax delafieldii TaxID=47920 RepID=A0A561XRV7_ACIDE|nr:tetratricopeptide repeat protein [Acidovorax delafieldii]TWG38857.1 tetratricopeptide (TPR) repeat protein [Acidovorax delafieldii]